MIQIQDLYIYPIKSLGGIRVDSSLVTDRGLAHDRRWMLVDENLRFLSQRECHRMALLQTAIDGAGIRVSLKTDPHQSFVVPFAPVSRESVEVEIWDDRCAALAVSAEADRWFSRMLGLPCRLVYMPEETRRYVDPTYAMNRDITSFSDGYPILAIFQESLDDLNARLAEKIPMDRFRPNLVLKDGNPYDEDRLGAFRIGDMIFRGVKPCARCVVTTIDQQRGTASAEPLKTLSTYRQVNHKVMFGQNIVVSGTGNIRVGDHIQDLNWNPPLFPQDDQHFQHRAT
jgi:uncharacterized protein YcbX